MKLTLSVAVLTASALLFFAPLSLVDGRPRPGTIKFTSDDGAEIEYTHEKHAESIGFFSATIKNMMDDLGAEAAGMPIPLANIKADALPKLLNYAKELYAAVGTMPNASDEDHVKVMEAATKAGGPVDNFIKAHCSTPELAIDYMNAANYLDNKYLLVGLSKNLAAWIETQRKTAEEGQKGKTPGKGETMEDLAAKVWVPIVNKMFGYDEQVQQAAQVQVPEGKQDATEVKKSKSTKSSRTQKSSKKGEEKKEKKDVPK